MEQLVARRAHNPKVISSSLVPATKTLRLSMSRQPFFISMFLFHFSCICKRLRYLRKRLRCVLC